MVKLITWNIARSHEAWRHLLDTDCDIALIQEAGQPPTDVAESLDIDPAPWWTAGGRNMPWRTAVVGVSDRAGVQWFGSKPIEDANPKAHPEELAVSRQGTLAAALVTPSVGEPFIAASVYAPWESPHPSRESYWIYADGSVHRLISDLSAFVGQEQGHRILVAGDLNILHGYGEYGSTYWASRYDTVFSRMAAMGLLFVGSQAPGGRQATPWPDELPPNSNNVPTYYPKSYHTPATASRQLDFVFASNSMAADDHVRARNEPEDWGPSDHCRVEIEIH